MSDYKELYTESRRLVNQAREMPVTQTTAVLPTASQYSWVG